MIESTKLLFVHEREGGLFLDPHTLSYLDLGRRVVLEDRALWDTYVAARQALEVARCAVLAALRRPLSAEVRDLPVPTKTELQELARFYVAECRRTGHEVDPRVISAHGAGLDDPRSATSEMVEALLHKGLIFWKQEGVYGVSFRGSAWLETAVTSNGVDPVTCPACDAPSGIAFTRLEEHFSYGIPPHAVELTAVVDKGRCSACAFEFTDWRAEDARDAAIQTHLSARA